MTKYLTKYLYDLYLTCKKNDCNDPIVDAMAMMMYDARSGERKYTDEQTDVVAMHADAEILDEYNRELRMFMTRHNISLTNAFKLGSREEFDKVVAKCIEKDEKN